MASRAKGCENVFLGANRRDGIKTQPRGGCFLKIPSKKTGDVIFVEAISLAGFWKIAKLPRVATLPVEKPQLLPAWAKRVP